MTEATIVTQNLGSPNKECMTQKIPQFFKNNFCTMQNDIAAFRKTSVTFSLMAKKKMNH